MTTAHHIRVTGPCRAKDEHLQAVNEVQARRSPSLLDPNFRYTKAAETDIRKLFARLKREQKQASVTPIRRK